MYSNSTNLGIYCYLGATFFGYFLPNFSIYSFSSSATACHLYRYIYCPVIFSESQIWQGERWGQQAFRIGCQRCNVEYANEPQMLYIYTYMICVRFYFRKNVFYIIVHINFTIIIGEVLPFSPVRNKLIPKRNIYKNVKIIAV